MFVVIICSYLINYIQSILMIINKEHSDDCHTSNQTKGHCCHCCIRCFPLGGGTSKKCAICPRFKRACPFGLEGASQGLQISPQFSNLPKYNTSTPLKQDPLSKWSLIESTDDKNRSFEPYKQSYGTKEAAFTPSKDFLSSNKKYDYSYEPWKTSLSNHQNYSYQTLPKVSEFSYAAAGPLNFVPKQQPINNITIIDHPQRQPPTPNVPVYNVIQPQQIQQQTQQIINQPSTPQCTCFSFGPKPKQKGLLQSLPPPKQTLENVRLGTPTEFNVGKERPFSMGKARAIKRDDGGKLKVADLGIDKFIPKQSKQTPLQRAPIQSKPAITLAKSQAIQIPTLIPSPSVPIIHPQAYLHQIIQPVYVPPSIQVQPVYYNITMPITFEDSSRYQLTNSSASRNSQVRDNQNIGSKNRMKRSASTFDYSKMRKARNEMVLVKREGKPIHPDEMREYVLALTDRIYDK